MTQKSFIGVDGISFNALTSCVVFYLHTENNSGETKTTRDLWLRQFRVDCRDVSDSGVNFT